MKRLLVPFACLIAIQAYAADIELPRPKPSSAAEPLPEVLFSATPLHSQQLSDLIWAVFGEKRSAGQLQGMDLYVMLSSGLYRYDVEGGRLVQMSEKDLRAQTAEKPLQGNPTVLVFVADYDRMQEGESFSATDVGAVSQSVYRFCLLSGFNTVFIGTAGSGSLRTAMELLPAQQVALIHFAGLPAEKADGPLVDGTYTGFAQGYNGVVEVEVTVEDGKIERIEVTRDEERRDENAMRLIPRRVRSSQSTDVDSVSGATITSDAIVQAVNRALEKAR